MKEKVTLYNLTEEIAAVDAALEEYADANDGLVHPELESMLDELELKKSAKLDAILAVYRNAKVNNAVQLAKAKAIEAEAKRFRANAKYHEGIMDSLKAYVDQHLELGEKHKGEFGSIYRQKRTNYVVTDAEKLAPVYYERKPKLKLIAEDIKSGATVEGAEAQEALSLIFR